LKVVIFVFAVLFAAVLAGRAQEGSARVNCEGFEGIKPPPMLLSVWAQPPKQGDYSIVALKCGEKVEVLGMIIYLTKDNEGV